MPVAMELGEGTTAGSASGDNESQANAGLRITDVRGLYRPDFDDRAARGSERRFRSGDCPRYVSHDDRGRVFINHRPRADPTEAWDRVRMRDTQYIELTATVRSTSGPPPANASVLWTWFEPDDSSDTGMHADAAREIDPNGDQSGDNRGRCDHPTLDSPTPAYEEIGSYTLSNAQGKTCETLVVNGKSRVRLHLTNVGGDSFRVRAELVGTPGAVHETGTMRMWKRLDVAYYQMDGDIPSLPLAEIAREFEIAFVQLDFVIEAKIPHRETVASGPELDTPARELIEQVFTKANSPGWFCLVAADLDNSVDNDFETVYNGPAQIVQAVDANQQPADEWVTVPNVAAPVVPGRSGPMPNLRDAVVAHISEGAVGPQTFDLEQSAENWPNPGEISFRLAGVRYISDFRADDGDVRTAYSRPTLMLPTRTRDPNGQWSPGGFGMSLTNVTVELEVNLGKTVSRARGVTPTVEKNGRRYWVGRSIVFTGSFRMQRGGKPRSQPFDQARALRTSVHELTHAFGLPHSCGYHSYDDPPDASCAMALPGQWLYQPGTRQLQHDHTGRLVPHLCPRHIIALRETHLEDNPAIWSWG